MDVPYTKIIVDSRHAAAGTSTNFDTQAKQGTDGATDEDDRFEMQKTA